MTNFQTYLLIGSLILNCVLLSWLGRPRRPTTPQRAHLTLYNGQDPDHARDVFEEWNRKQAAERDAGQ